MIPPDIERQLRERLAASPELRSITISRSGLGAWNAQRERDGTIVILPMGLGDRVERLVKPIAKVLKLGCLQSDGTLKPASPCAQRRDRLNRL